MVHYFRSSEEKGVSFKSFDLHYAHCQMYDSLFRWFKRDLLGNSDLDIFSQSLGKPGTKDHASHRFHNLLRKNRSNINMRDQTVRNSLSFMYVLHIRFYPTVSQIDFTCSLVVPSME